MTPEQRQGMVDDYFELRGWGLTLTQAAERMGISTRNAQRWENKRREEEAEREGQDA